MKTIINHFSGISKSQRFGLGLIIFISLIGAVFLAETVPESMASVFYVGTFFFISFKYAAIQNVAKKAASTEEPFFDLKALNDSKLSTANDLTIYYSAINALNRLKESGKINIRILTLHLCGNAVVNLTTWKLIFKQHPILLVVLISPIFIFDFDLVTDLVIGASFFTLFYQAERFKGVVREALKTVSEAEQSEADERMDRVSKLHTLFKSGALTESEFEEQKQKLLKKSA